MGLTYRRLTADDIERMRELLRMFGDAFGEPETYAAHQRRLLSGETFIAVAALADSRVVGGLAAYELTKFEQARSEIYLYDLAVAASHRRRGIATALIAELRTLAAQRGIGVIFVQADRGDDAAIALYSRLGACAEVLHFDIAAD